NDHSDTFHAIFSVYAYFYTSLIVFSENELFIIFSSRKTRTPTSTFRVSLRLIIINIWYYNVLAYKQALFGVPIALVLMIYSSAAGFEPSKGCQKYFTIKTSATCSLVSIMNCQDKHSSPQLLSADQALGFKRSSASVSNSGDHARSENSSRIKPTFRPRKDFGLSTGRTEGYLLTLMLRSAVFTASGVVTK